MDSLLRALTLLSEDPGSVPGTPTLDGSEQLVNQVSGTLMPPSGLHRYCMYIVSMHTSSHKYT